MAEYITPEVREEIASADRGARLELAIVPDRESGSDVQKRADEYDGVVVDRTLPSGVLLVTYQVGTAEDFLSTPMVRSVSFPDRGEIMN